MNKYLKKIICISLMVILALGCCSTVSFGATKTKTMKVYSECYKSGSYVYCIAGDGIYKVNLKTKNTKQLVSIDYPSYEGYEWLKLYKGYIYTYYTAIEDDSDLFRVKTNGKNKELLANFYTYDVTAAISKGKIYYRYGYYDKNDNEKFAKRKMKLNGKKKCKTVYKAKNKYLHTNNKRYRVRSKEVGDDIYEYYLTTKTGTIYLTTVDFNED